MCMDVRSLLTIINGFYGFQLDLTLSVTLYQVWAFSTHFVIISNN